jgi:hypothetical protein
MNKANREAVAKIRARLEDLLLQAEAIGDELQTMADDEQEKFDNMPEGLQQGEQGQAIETAASLLGEAASACESGELADALESLNSIE